MGEKGFGLGRNRERFSLSLFHNCLKSTGGKNHDVKIEVEKERVGKERKKERENEKGRFFLTARKGGEIKDRNVDHSVTYNTLLYYITVDVRIVKLHLSACFVLHEREKGKNCYSVRGKKKNRGSSIS